MAMSLILSLFTFLFIAAITPGPNNLLLTTVSANYGLGRAFSLLFGIILGMQSLLYLSAFGVAALLLIYPQLHSLMKILGSLYLVWLAWKTVSADYQPIKTDSNRLQSVTWYQGALLQFLNPKAWLMALGAVGSYSFAGDLFAQSIIIMSIAMALVNFVTGVIWMVAGTLIGRFLRSRQAWFLFNLIMGLLTLICVPLIWFE